MPHETRLHCQSLSSRSSDWPGSRGENLQFAKWSGEAADSASLHPTQSPSCLKILQSGRQSTVSSCIILVLPQLSTSGADGPDMNNNKQEAMPTHPDCKIFKRVHKRRGWKSSFSSFLFGIGDESVKVLILPQCQRKGGKPANYRRKEEKTDARLREHAFFTKPNCDPEY